MNSIERTMSAITHHEPDRVPLFLLLSLYGAKELGLPIKTYFSDPKNVVKAQLLMKEKYRNDCIYTFFYAPIEIEAFGGDVIFVDDGPPNSGAPCIKSMKDIDTLKVPDIEKCEGLQRVLSATRQLKEAVGNETPIIGVVMSPFSLPVMQMGFEKYLDLIYFHPEQFNKLMQVNEAFCVNWANAQLAAGATAICYFNPLASPNIIEKSKYLTSGYLVDKKTLSQIKGPTATHLASGIALSMIDEIAASGSLIVGFSGNDDLVKIKAAAKDRICLLGNLNGIEMVHWSSEQVEDEVKNLIAKAGIGGGLIISDNHGEIPWQVPEQTLMAISDAVHTFGQYPLQWINNEKT